jgi:hypothetical protein
VNGNLPCVDAPVGIGEVKGFRYLPVDNKRKNEPFLSAFLKRKWEQGL